MQRLAAALLGISGGVLMIDKGWEKYFESLEKRLSGIEQKLDVLVGEKHKKDGGVMVISIICSVIVSILAAFIGRN